MFIKIGLMPQVKKKRISLYKRMNHFYYQMIYFSILFSLELLLRYSLNEKYVLVLYFLLSLGSNRLLKDLNFRESSFIKISLTTEPSITYDIPHIGWL